MRLKNIDISLESGICPSHDGPHGTTEVLERRQADAQKNTQADGLTTGASLPLGRAERLDLARGSTHGKEKEMDDKMYEWIEHAGPDKMVYDFTTPNVYASLYKTSSPPDENGQDQYYFQATTNVTDGDIDGYFHANDLTHAKNITGQYLKKILSDYKAQVNRAIGDIDGYMTGAFV